MSGPTAVVDTSIFVGAKNPEEPEHQDCERVLELAHQGRFHALVSAVTVAEVCAGYYLEKDDPGRAVFLDYLSSAGVFEIVPLDTLLADRAARVRSETSLKLPDAIILASGLERGASFVVTHDSAFAKASGLLTALSARECLRKLERD